MFIISTTIIYYIENQAYFRLKPSKISAAKAAGNILNEI